jgi:glycosyltransferase involved in cell wall biosynthesis
MLALKSRFAEAMVQRGLRSLASRFKGEDGIAVSVLCPTRNHASYLDLSLSSILESQSFPRQFYEVVVADNASLDGTQEVLRRYSKKETLPLRTLLIEREQGCGPIWNQLFKAARGEILLLWDSSMIASSDLLTRHLMAHLEGEFLVCGGPCPYIHSHLVPPGKQEAVQCELFSIAAEAHNRHEHLLQFAFWDDEQKDCSSKHSVSWFDFDTTHASFRRRTLIQNDGFLSGQGIRDLGDWGLLGRDFALRATKNGIEMRILGVHCAWRQIQPTDWVNLHEAERHLSRFLRDHPEIVDSPWEGVLREQLLPGLSSA